MLNRSLQVIITLLLVLSLAACSGLQLGAPDDTPEVKQKKAYMAAVKEFALTLQKYNTYYDQADEETQAKWKKNIDPAFKQVDLALAAWKLAMDNNFDPAANEQAYLQLKADLLILLLNVFN